MASDDHVGEPARRRILKMVVCALCYDAGFRSADNSAVETLTEMLQSYLSEAGRSSRAFCELSGRTEAMLSDVVISLIEMGANVSALPAYAKKGNKSVFIPPTQSAPALTPMILEAGQRQPHPFYVPDHMPPFPGPHTYIRTPTHRQPVSDYQLVREKAASQKRDIERALTRFIAKTGKTQKLFNDDAGAFPLIAVKPSPLPYLDALLPKDQDLDAQAPMETQRALLQQRREEAQTVGEEKNAAVERSAERFELSVDSTDSDAIDNPYLRAVKMPKIKKSRR